MDSDFVILVNPVFPLSKVPPRRSNRGMKRTLVILLLSAGALAPGCVEREWTLETDPPGAIVYVSDVEVGRTPVTLDFTWYGDYEVVFRLDG